MIPSSDALVTGPSRQGPLRLHPGYGEQRLKIGDSQSFFFEQRRSPALQEVTTRRE